MLSDNVTMNDLVVLGEAVPDELKDGRKVVCTACYSHKYGLIRIYPIPPKIRMRRWDLMNILLEKNPQDTRVESWKVQGSKSEWDKLEQNISSRGNLKRQEWIKLGIIYLSTVYIYPRYTIWYEPTSTRQKSQRGNNDYRIIQNVSKQ